MTHRLLGILGLSLIIGGCLLWLLLGSTSEPSAGAGTQAASAEATRHASANAGRTPGRAPVPTAAATTEGLQGDTRLPDEDLRRLLPHDGSNLALLQAVTAGFEPPGSFPVVSAEHPHLEIFTDLERPIKERIPEDFRERLTRIDDEILREALLALLMRQDQDLLVRHESANVLIASGDARATTALALIALDRGDVPRMRGYALQHLENARDAGLIDEPALWPIYGKVLDWDDLLEVQREALLNAARASDQIVLTAIMSDPDAPQFQGMEDIVMQVWLERDLRGKHLERQAVQWLIDQQEAVQVAACQVVARWRIEEARAALEGLLASPSPSVQRAAQQALDRL